MPACPGGAHRDNGLTLQASKQLGVPHAISDRGAILHGARISRFDGLHLTDLDWPPMHGIDASVASLRASIRRYAPKAPSIVCIDPVIIAP